VCLAKLASWRTPIPNTLILGARKGIVGVPARYSRRDGAKINVSSLLTRLLGAMTSKTFLTHLHLQRIYEALHPPVWLREISNFYSTSRPALSKS
jgi:hypothetical protein